MNRGGSWNTSARNGEPQQDRADDTEHDRNAKPQRERAGHTADLLLPCAVIVKRRAGKLALESGAQCRDVRRIVDIELNRDEARDFFTNVIGLYKNWNYSPQGSPEYVKYKTEIERVAQQPRHERLAVDAEEVPSVPA